MGSSGSKPTTSAPTAAGALAQDGAPNTPEGGQDKPKCKPCCACPETRKARDLCLVERGEENCQDLIEAHKECMRKLGFRVA